MRIRVIAVGTRLPQWAQAAVDEYAKRMPPECRIEVCPVAAASRPRKPDVPRMLRDEAQRIEALLLPGAVRGALDERGREWRTADLAGALGEWIADSRDVCMLIGGADGLMPELRARADFARRQAGVMFGRVTAAAGGVAHGEHQRDGDERGRDDASDEEAPDRRVGQQAVDDEADRGRHDRGDGA